MGWEQVADAVVVRRVKLGMRTRRQLAEKSGLTVKTLGEIERNERTSYDRSTLAAVEQALDWTPGTIAALVANAPVRTEYLSIDPHTFVLLDPRGRELDPGISDLIHFMSPDSALDDEARDLARQLLHGVVMTLAALAREKREVRRLAGAEADGVEIPDQVPGYLADAVEPRAAARPDSVQR